MAAVLAAFFIPGAAYGQMLCDDRDSFLKHLRNGFAEAPTAAGIAANGGVLEILASPDGRTWTALITLPNGRSCVVASGKDWESFGAAVAAGPET